ncbi:alpha/beta-hydrolase [Phlegmacium glaucopus]|nr:alpha/beta-hydrolase [Phlegmacium glaucopus]
MLLASSLLITSFLLPYASSQVSLTFHQQHLELASQLSPSPSHILLPSPVLKARPTIVYRPRSLDALRRTRLRSLYHAQSELEPLIWDPVNISGPDIEDLHTLAQLARMSANAYASPDRKSWFDIDDAWKYSFPFGWQGSDGFRGHVFLSSDNSTIVLSIKGTTLQGPTSELDKFNDNLLFSCCCARVDFSWIFSTVCDCYANYGRCDNKCLTKALVQESLFYSVGVKLLDDLIQIYPSANVWLVGHSLGGALASLLGATYGLPAVAFESPGERLAASRLHLPLPPPIPPSHPPTDSISLAFPLTTSSSQSPDPFSSPSLYHPIATTHVYHNADPIPQGTCTGFGSPCTLGGYALETRCHLGKSVVFDSVGRLGWSVDVMRHPIKELILTVLEADVWWGDEDAGEEEGDGAEVNVAGFRETNPRKSSKDGGGDEQRERKRNVPKAIIEEGCVDCYKWEFGDFLEDKKTMA